MFSPLHNKHGQNGSNRQDVGGDPHGQVPIFILGRRMSMQQILIDSQDYTCQHHLFQCISITDLNILISFCSHSICSWTNTSDWYFSTLTHLLPVVFFLQRNQKWIVQHCFWKSEWLEFISWEETMGGSLPSESIKEHVPITQLDTC